ncbi:MAG: hypothetical protein A2817_02310 [Candidatus Yanofskybacteria bacterium RIFCSPHIGHO2_01_FULL_39_8b]|uniref:Uncharacterized protein n=1 Tax=Candidatus Yanofskybacteria bacterium RIFCSPHIGHO2_01_FULL_39_8b TaxID=1802659 RepID=A0A1F8ED45_9BACT|nr:MAG: hypothetical protein A2817_02310 [Candidatus Yanofskybacteria bacterium RIFCSPHIGHO2_01_FULL_39_8b]
MVEDIEWEFFKLKNFTIELADSFRDKKVMRSEHLLKINDQIRLCDHLAETRIQIYYLFIAFSCWEKYYKFFLKYRPNVDTVAIPNICLKTKKYPGQETKEPPQTEALVKIKNNPDNPKKTWEETITKNDKCFLRSLRIAAVNPELCYPEEDENDGA